MNDADEGCWLPQRFRRVVWIVIDALRYDFAAFAPLEGESREGVGKPQYAKGEWSGCWGLNFILFRTQNQLLIRLVTALYYAFPVATRIMFGYRRNIFNTRLISAIFVHL